MNHRSKEFVRIAVVVAGCAALLLLVAVAVFAAIARRRRRAIALQRAAIASQNAADSAAYADYIGLDALARAQENACDLRNQCASFLPS